MLKYSEMRQAKEAVIRGARWLRKRLIPVLGIVLVIAITVGIYLFYGRHPERLYELRNYTYIGAFLISLIGNATIVFPGAVLPILSTIGVLLYPTTGPIGPVIVGLVGSAGAAIGEMTGYVAGYSGRELAQKRRIYGRVEKWMQRWGSLTIFVLSIAPLIFDVVGITAGILRFPFWKFFLLCLLGRVILYVGSILAVAWGWRIIFPG